MRPLAILLCLLLSSCGNLMNLANKARSKRQAKQLDKLAEASAEEASSRLGKNAVGEVVCVNTDDGYVLVRARNGHPLKVSDELECRGAGNGRLKVTPERNRIGDFAADIVSGAPQKGDSVVAVKGTQKEGPKLVPIVANALPGSSAPANTFNVDPSSIRPEDLPKSTLSEPGTMPAPVRAPSHSADPGNLLLPPPLVPPELPQ